MTIRSGKVTIHSLDAIAGQPAGLWEFEPAGSRVSLDSLSAPSFKGVQSLIVSTGAGEVSQRLVWGYRISSW